MKRTRLRRRHRIQVSLSDDENAAVLGRMRAKGLERPLDYVLWLIERDCGPGWPDSQCHWVDIHLPDD